MARTPSEMLQGTVDILILRALAWEPMHGYAISRWLDARSDGVLAVDGAALYQALHRLERRKWVARVVGPLREQPQGEVLHAHRRRARAAARRVGGVDAATRTRCSKVLSPA